MSMVRNTPSFTGLLARVDFPFECLPEDFAPGWSILLLPNGGKVHSFLWCYLDRKRAPSAIEFALTSLSIARVEAMPSVVERLSKSMKFDGIRPSSMERDLGCLSQFLAWADAAENGMKFERVLADRELALEALKSHHSFLRQLVQTHQLNRKTAALRDQRVIKLLSVIHDRQYKDEIEPLASRATGVQTLAPQDEEVGAFLSVLQSVFDSAAEAVLADDENRSLHAKRSIRFGAVHTSSESVLPLTYTKPRLMELACVAFAGLALADSGANLAQIQKYEEPEDLLEQLAAPDRISLTRRVVKLRAGGRQVPVSFSAIVFTRIRTYLEVRRRLVASLGGADIVQLFVQCRYERKFSPMGRDTWSPTHICGLSEHLLAHVRNKVRIVGGDLPRITFRQLRLYKQQHLVRTHGVQVAAETMGHSVATAIAAYCRTQESVRYNELGQFLASLRLTVLDRADGYRQPNTTAVAHGSCTSHGHPLPLDGAPPVIPDCKRYEGCFFCSEYRVHADEEDLRKLMSCRYVLARLLGPDRDGGRARGALVAVMDRIDALVAEIRHRDSVLTQQNLHRSGR